MNYNFQKTSNVVAELTISIEKADYQDRVDKALKDLRRKAQLPGFRAGQVPMSIIQKRFGNDVVAEQVQKFLSEKLYAYLRDEKVNMLGEPLASSKQQAVDFNAPTMDFIFDIALAPEFDAKVSSKDRVPYYTIDVTDDMVQQQVNMYASRAGHYEHVDTYQAGDMVKGHMAELDADGNILEGGVHKEDAVLLPTYMKNEDQKKKFDGLQVNTVLTLNPSIAYDGSAIEISTLLGIDKEAAAELKSDFSFQVTEISRYTPAELTQELFDQVLGEGRVNSEDEFRAAIRQEIEQQFAVSARFRFMADVRAYLEKRIGELEWPDELLKRIMRANNPDKDDAYVEQNYAPSIKELEWHLIKEQLADQTAIKVEQPDVLAVAKEQVRMQFAQYGMSNVPDELVERYANEQMAKRDAAEGYVSRAVENKLSEALKTILTLDEKTISLEEFNKL